MHPTFYLLNRPTHYFLIHGLVYGMHHLCMKCTYTFFKQ